MVLSLLLNGMMQVREITYKYGGCSYTTKDITEKVISMDVGGSSMNFIILISHFILTCFHSQPSGHCTHLLYNLYIHTRTQFYINYYVHNMKYNIHTHTIKSILKLILFNVHVLTWSGMI